MLITLWSINKSLISSRFLQDSGEAAKESMSGFTGPKFGLELLFNLEKDQYMPVSREAGVKITVHDR